MRVRQAVKRPATTVSLCALLLLNVLTLSAQTRFQVGQKVEVNCDCLGGTAWIPATIEEEQLGGTYRIRYGTGTYEYRNGVSSQNIRELGATDRLAKQAERRRLFMGEAEQYRRSVGAVARLFDSTLFNATAYSVPGNATEWALVMKDLTALDQLCTQKYPLLKNPEPDGGPNNIFQMPATWCEIAANRASYQQSAADDSFRSKLDVNVGFARNQMQRSIDAQKNSTPDDIQKLLFEPEKWKAELMKLIGAPTTPFPSEAFAKIEEKSSELKQLIEQGAPTRGWEPPPFNRPVEQNMARAKFLNYYPGATLLKIGSNFGDWKMYKNSLGIPTNRFIRGVALLKMPNRPFCQLQEWIVKQEYSGGGGWTAAKVDSFGGGGVFMRCD